MNPPPLSASGEQQSHQPERGAIHFSLLAPPPEPASSARHRCCRAAAVLPFRAATAVSEGHVQARFAHCYRQPEM